MSWLRLGILFAIALIFTTVILSSLLNKVDKVVTTFQVQKIVENQIIICDLINGRTISITYRDGKYEFKVSVADCRNNPAK